MTILNAKTTVLGTCLLLLTSFVHAQIAKGVSNIDGGMSINNTIDNSGYFANKNLGTSISPTFGHFLTDKIMVKGKLSGEVSHYSYFNTNINNVGIDIEGRYYFNPKSNWKYFAGVSLGVNTFKYDYFSNNISDGYTLRTLNYGAFVGGNKFLNNEIALEGRIGFSYGLGEQKAVFYPGQNQRTNDIGLDIGLTNFINFKNKTKDFDGLIDEGRIVANGHLSTHFFNTRNEGGIYYRGHNSTLNADYGQFFAKGLLLAGKFDGQANEYTINGTASLYAQYFYPITKRFMLNAKAGFDYSFEKYKHSYLAISGGLGATYFLTKNVAIDLNLINFSKSTDNNHQKVNFGVGLRYFLK